MISKLRKKFILVIMLCVMSTISIAIGSLFVINYINYKNNLNNFLERELHMNMGFPNNEKPDKEHREEGDFFSFMPMDDKPMHFLPSVFIMLDEDGLVADSKINYLELSNDDIKNLANTIVSLKQSRGRVSSYNLDYITVKQDGLTYIVAADNSFESGNIRNLLVLCLLSFILSFFVFFVISLILSA